MLQSVQPNHEDAVSFHTVCRGYVENPDSMRSNVKALKGLGLKRLRIGDWRVIFDESGNVLTIVKIGARGSVYD